MAMGKGSGIQDGKKWRQTKSAARLGNALSRERVEQVKRLLRLRRSTATTVTVATVTVAATIAGIAATTAPAFAGPFVEFFAATTARPFILALWTIAATGLLHAAGAAGVLALVDGAGLRFRRAGAIARSECDFKLVEFVPLGIGTVAIRDRKQFLHARARRRR